MRLILHVDLDAFYASVEELDHPDYVGAPLVVGADPKGGHGRGVVTTANYAARAFGIRSAMPISEAWRRCPTARFVYPRFERYHEMSDAVYEVLHEASEVVEGAGIDEAYLDVSSRARTFDDAVALARDLQARILERTRLSASIGVATGKVLAKVASDFRKPGGITAVAPGTEAEFLAPLPARRIPGIGPKTEARLTELGILTVGDVAALSPQRLLEVFGSWGPRLGQLARGVDDAPVVTGWDRKSVGSETTFLHDVDEPARLEATLKELAADLAASLTREGRRARTFTLKVRLAGFDTYTRARTLTQPVADAPTIARHALELLHASPPSRAVRLLGLRANGLTEPATGAQATLARFPEAAPVDALQDPEADEARRRARAASLRDWPADVLGEDDPWRPPQQRLDRSWR